YPGAQVNARTYAKVADEQAEYANLSPKQMAKRLRQLEDQMYQHAQDLEFEEAARIRDLIKSLQDKGLVA
ncbi:MAG: UvrB/UvrC motif-containing protein, partial [Candidatus Thiodiazotropha sp. (ex Semelilucina semeliformis)]|nr:UvrB/UvrC motif-containing protein [Candidatus Thiodiazotropha sp. (ex Semelilucina semeliformis)]